MRRVVIVTAIVWLLVLAAAGAFYFMWRAKPSVKAVKPGDDKQFVWLTKALDACEAEAGRYPQSLYFMVVPLTSVPGAGDDIRSRALETIGPATLLESKVALDGLESGALRISREQYILHLLDTPTSTTRRWNSATGVSTLSDRANASKGPFKIRLQIGPSDTDQWSGVTADGVATCHWVFAILQR